MSIFSNIGSWLAGIFNKARPGLGQFVASHEASAVQVLSTVAKDFEGIPLSQWRDNAFQEMSVAFNSAKQHPDTWISLLIDLAYDIIKAQAKATA
jgi:hypothetical protein